MFIQSGGGPAKARTKPEIKADISRATGLLDKVGCAVQKLCKEIRGLPQARNLRWKTLRPR
jgi:hypothetical protein